MELQVIQNKIYEIRGQKVILDFDLADMYQIETRRLKEQVRRNIERFPSDFMFELSREEYNFLRSQIASLKNGRGKYSKYLPFVFTEQGVAMLSSVLNSPLAIEINISIMRAFVTIRNYLLQQSTVSKEIEDIWKAINDLSEDNRKEFDDIYLVLTELASKQKKINESTKPRNPIGYI